MNKFDLKQELLNLRYIIKGFLINDNLHARLRFNKAFGRSINLKNPKTFNEKIQWLKLHYRKPVYTTYVDKYKVREIIKEKIGDHILNELYGVYDRVEDIDFSSLPDSFVLKATHGSGTNLICKDKSQLDLKEVFVTLKYWLKRSYYLKNREWPYKNVPRRIICEKFLAPKNGIPLYDYKFFCFNGKARYIQVDIDRHDEHKRVFYNLNWEKQPFQVHYPIFNEEIRKPEKLKEMIKYAEILSENEPFLRIDFYQFDNKIYFGEITMYPGNGYDKFTPEEYDSHFGKLLKLPEPVS